ncbi:hypothetical protein TIFTF001_026074 [Ficus carica]|uniref:Uncharacterized protein n=1 Tax=Ficus carica TaxID=3494 RepID=A0AA88ARQ0_FICCA|nr:hypothetical protein TIFTF001_026074 [Ficus carica]
MALLGGEDGVNRRRREKGGWRLRRREKEIECRAAAVVKGRRNRHVGEREKGGRAVAVRGRRKKR